MMIPTLALNWRSRREIVAAIPLKTLGWYPIMKVSRLNTHLKMGTDCNSIALDSPAQIGLRLSQSCTTKQLNINAASQIEAMSLHPPNCQAVLNSPEAEKLYAKALQDQNIGIPGHQLRLNSRENRAPIFMR